jgi:hypothetical protein
MDRIKTTKTTIKMKDYDLTKLIELMEFSIKELKAISEPKRWRAEKGERFYFMLADFTIKRIIEEPNNRHYDDLYNSGNYFKTEAECQEFCDKVKSLLR